MKYTRPKKEHQAKIRALAKRFGVHADYREKKWWWRHYRKGGRVENWLDWDGSGTEDELMYFLVTIKMGGRAEDAVVQIDTLVGHEDENQPDGGASSDSSS